MTTDYKAIYAHHAAGYDELVAREDYRGHLRPALEAIRPLAGLRVVELGAGTGRLTRLLAPAVGRLLACDLSAHMLATARARLAGLALANWELAVADNRQLPVADGAADLALAGWSLGHFCGWYPDTWRQEIGRAVAEMKRAVPPGGTVVILETLGTGRESPRPPTPALADYYAWLEQEHGFAASWVRTDYRFASPAEAERLTQFFFGEELAGRVRAEGLVVLPECTGLWFLQREG
ncbi:MAG: methyltransferase domain-containing protein [Chloroflexi bacterium]|nr:methyltransferase domain-containing protein [Chloroflexota bacterium]MCI0578291.1 methyltransferase domain-containing protein [Chloroflexota bacterium]MCI0648760.1 methyltransferase domain-containing protein [Chloroflexota bacterium]MCI0727228.1 methyltransferase domain-containing protein [Chloroflexota bacterium]